MGPIIGMTPDKKAETPGLQERAGLRPAPCGTGTLPEAESAASPRATSLDRGPGDDEELTNLNWLHENLLQNFTLGSEAQPSVSPLFDIEGDGVPPPSFSSSSSSSSSSSLAGREKDSLKSKPPYSFSLLIYMAIEQSPNKCLPVKEIYSWILEHFPYFSSAPTGWKNSVRHNLSLNKCFRKVERSLGKANGKGSLWCVDPEYRPNLIQALKKQHFPSAHAFCTPPASPPSASSPPRHLIPQDQSCSLKESDIDAATAMMLLNSAPEQHRMECRAVQDRPMDLSRPEVAVVSSDPKEDHNYSASFQRCVSRCSTSSLSSLDEGYQPASQARRAGSEGFHSDEDSDLAEEPEEAQGRLGDSGYGASQRGGGGGSAPRPRAKGPPGKKARREAKPEIDEELKEAAGSLLHLAGIRTCLDASRRTAKSKSRKSKK
ncbi:forkhead box protein N2 isoform X2 [Lepisosteus oculatus]|nr:PREDICTED: forkhead box protein N2 isoform X2 [Lepisosteus oculatus]XP_015218565.1 PREDICTED: forkhead box protein N2 isoform X2 [Lepisosteus oculatus]XP_015218567.1 PREDICTED: forkhead box protein N2 isoform X2 [Lepisosteus oculatus]